MAPTRTSLLSTLISIFILSPFTPSAAQILVPENLPTPWAYQGCYVDVGRTLTGATYTDNTNMTNEACIGFCVLNEFGYAGTEFTSQCFCGSSLTSGASPASSFECSMPCAGNSSEVCGGPNLLTLFWTGQANPQTNPGTGPWSFAGCYTEGTDGRALPNAVTTIGKLTVDNCTSACQSAGYVLAGMEFADECWCANSLFNNATLASEGVSECSMLCAGNTTEYCGGPNRLDVYEFNSISITLAPTTTATTLTTQTSLTTPSTNTPIIQSTAGPYLYYGCQTEGTDERALASVAFASDNMSLELCEANCGGYTYFGTEYGRECYCGNSFSKGSIPAPNTDCSFACAGNSSEFCGAGNRLSVYQLNVTSTNSATSPTISVIAVTGLPSDWAYSGCWVEGAEGRILNEQQPDSQNLTIQSCVETCVSLNYTIAGLEYSAQCFCDDFIENGGALAISQELCSMECTGNSAQICGGPDLLSIFSLGTPKEAQSPSFQTRDVPRDRVCQSYDQSV